MAEEEQEERPPDPEVCPACGSADIHRRKRAVVFAVIGAIAFASGLAFDQTEAAFFFIAAAAIFAMVSDRWACAACDSTWK